MARGKCTSSKSRAPWPITRMVYGACAILERIDPSVVGSPSSYSSPDARANDPIGEAL
jgi:hypothetical protein